MSRFDRCAFRGRLTWDVRSYLAGGQLLGDVITRATDLSITGNTTVTFHLQGNSGNVAGTVNSGLTVNVRGANDGSVAVATLVGGSVSNHGTVVLDSINSSWSSTLTGNLIN